MASIVLVGLAAEVVARMMWQPVTPRRGERPEAWEGLEEIRGIYNLARPNVRAIFAGALYETNSAGFRGPERSEAKPPGTFRIVVTGDSVTMGSGVVEEDTYVARVERRLREQDAPHRYELLNVGLGGLNAGHVIRRLEQLGLRFDPDLVVYGYTLNDIEGPRYRRTRTDHFTDSQRFDHSPLYLVRILGPRWLSLQELVRPPVGSYVYELDDNYLHNPAAWNDVLSALDRLAEIAREREMCALVLIHTRLNLLHALHPFRRLYDRVAAAAEERGLHVARSFARFRGRRAPELWVGPMDPHPNPRGHALLADALLEGLESLPGRCWRGASPFAHGSDTHARG